MIKGVHEVAYDTIEVAAASGGYQVFVGPSLLASVPAVVATYAPARRLAVISDDRVGPIHGETVAEALRDAGHDITFLTFPEGEASKTRKFWSILTDQMLEAGLQRDCAVVAVGGGVTTDLAGFVAATFLRGVPVIQVPTTTLSMVDASVGGKTGVNVRNGKNLVGAFHAPSAVVADTEVLGTLDPRFLAEGLVEAVKHGVILDEEHFLGIANRIQELILADPKESARCVTASVRLKSQVVARDEFERGLRQVLNFGHTVGHALEAATDYRLGHGRAVAFGMIAEARIGERLGLTEPKTSESLTDVLAELVDRTALEVETSTVLGFLSADKKARDGRTRYVLLRRIGQALDQGGWAREVDEDVVRSAVDEVISGW
ncbi:MAG TPA: 3-dehydroquinate synthase [Gemmatimonadetes bacterium]|nr:3-dehydroquinate synthase [Gemmatimonadota bacterium]